MSEDSQSTSSASTDLTYTHTANSLQDSEVLELKRLKAQRGQKRGVATRLSKKLQLLLKKDPSSISADIISALHQDIKDCVDKHDEIQLSIDSCASDPDAFTPHEEREKHIEVHNSLLDEIRILSSVSKAHRDARSLSKKLRNLLALDSAVSTHQDQYTEVSTAYSTFSVKKKKKKITK